MTEGESDRRGGISCLPEEELFFLAGQDLHSPGAVWPAHLESCQECRKKVEEFKARIRAQAESPTALHPDPQEQEDREGALPESIGGYRILGRLGSGGQGVIYRAYDAALARDVVVKLGYFRLSDSGADRQSFEEEGKAIRGLTGSFFPQVHAYGEFDGRPYLVLEYFQGRTLANHAGSEPLTADQAARVARQLSHALCVMHSAGVCHLDIKPENVIVDDDLSPRLVDFGLAMFRGPWKEPASGNGFISGTVAYMAPEQARGESNDLGPRTDIFLVGATLFTLLAGTPPYHGRDTKTCLQRARRCDFDLSRLQRKGVPRELRTICLRAMEARPEDRYGNAADMARDLERYLARKQRAVRVARAAGVAIACAMLVGILWVSWSRRNTPPDGPVPVEVQGLVVRDGEHLDIESAFPLQDDDGIRLEFRLRGEMPATIFWFDTSGTLQELPVAARRSPGAVRYIYPASEGLDFKPLEGKWGTEVVFLCASAERKPTRSDVDDLVVEGVPWPKLEPFTLMTFDGLGLSFIRTDRHTGGRFRGPGEGLVRAPDTVPYQAERLRSELSRRFDVVKGIVFPHYGK